MSKQRFVVFLSVFFTLFLGFISGCGSSHGHNYAAQYYGLGTLSGNIALSNANPSLRLQASGTPAVGAEVWVEELPTLKATTDSSGNYIIKNVPVGDFHVVAKLITGGNTYKMRSNSCQLKAGDEAKNDFSIFQAKNIVKGIIRSEDGLVLPAGAQIWLWGESFTVDENGRFETPPMPAFAGLDAIHEIVVNRGQPNEFRIPVSFVADDQPLEVDLTIPANQGNVNTLPKVTLIATKNDKLCKKVFQNEQLTVMAKVFPADANNLTWSATAGSITQTLQINADKRISTWIAPNALGIATISAELKNADGKIAKAFLPILVERVPNFFVTFDNNGGDTEADPRIVSVAPGGKISSLPVPPTKKNRVFSHWRYDGSKFDGTEPIASDITVYAVYSIFSGGSGTEADPYGVETPYQLFKATDGSYNSKSYIQIADIDLDHAKLSLEDWYDSSKGWESNRFYGTYDGKNFKISNLYINDPDRRNVGLFSFTEEKLKNIRLLDVNINAGYFVGSIAGFNQGVISACCSSGNIIAKDLCGGLVGSNLKTLENSYSSCNVTGGAAGGLVGKIGNANSPDINIVVSNCFSTGKVTGGVAYSGGLIAYQQGNNNHYTNCYWDTESSEMVTSKGDPANVIGKTTAEMKQQATFADWDFDNIWQIYEGVSYPTLR
jgi:hypothetical protein